VGGQGAAGRPKLRVERQPFLASKAVIFGVNPTGPHILVVMYISVYIIIQNAGGLLATQKIVLYHLNNRHHPLHVLDPVTDIFYETPGNSGLDSLVNEETRVLILEDVLKFEAI
jgi:hypothetical protein